MAQSTVRLIVDAQNAIRPLQRVNEQTKALSNSTNKLKGRLDKSNKSLRDTGSSARTASKGVKGLVSALRPLLAALAVVGTGKFVIFQTAELERQTKALTVLTGSAEEAQKIVQQIKEFGAVTPFKSSELIEVAKRMKAFGFETEKVVDITKRIADIAGTAGADIDGVALAIGKVQAKNKFMQEENIMLLEKGINVTKELEKITGMTGEELAKAMSKGEVGADLFVEAIVRATSKGGEFFGGASAQSDTLFGKFSTLVDGVETLAQRVGEKLEPALKSALDVAIGLVNRVNQAIAAGSITDVDKKAFQKQAQGIVQEQAGRFPGGPFGTGQVSVDFAGQTFEGQPAGVTSQITNALINAEVAKRLKQQLEVQKQLEKSTKVVKDNNKENQEAINSIGFTFTEGLVPSTEFFNKNLDLSKGFLHNIDIGSLKISDSFKIIKTDADLLKEKFAEIGQSVEDGIVSNLTDAVMGTKTLAQAAISVLDNLKRKLVEVAIQKAVAGIGGRIGGFFSSLFGKRASGGPVAAGGAYLVGERGPEILQMGSRGGNIIPNNQIGGGGTTNVVTVNVDASGSSVAGNGSEADALGQLIGGIVQQTLVREQRAGGLLNR